MKGRVWVAPAGTDINDPTTEWKELGTVSEVDIVRGPEAGPACWDEPFYTINPVAFTHVFHFPNRLAYRNYYRIVTGTSRGLPSLIHKGKKPRR